MLRPVVQYPNPLLAKKSEPVAEINDEIRALAQDMLDTLKTVGGVGIAAPQIGVLKRVVIIDVSPQLDKVARHQGAVAQGRQTHLFGGHARIQME